MSMCETRLRVRAALTLRYVTQVLYILRAQINTKVRRCERTGNGENA